MRRSGRFRWLRLVPILGLALSWMLGTQAAVAQTSSCAIEIGGQALALANAPERAIPVVGSGSVLVAGVSDRPVTWVDVGITVWPVPPVVQRLAPSTPTQRWAGELSVAEYSRFGGGLYQVSVTTDVPDCAIQGWVNVTGRSLFETPAGWVGLGIVTVGVLIALRAVFSRRTGGPVAVLGGVIAGVGLLLLAQQAGLHAITPLSAVIWTALPGAIGGIANVVGGAFTSAVPVGGVPPPYSPPAAPATPPYSPPAAPAGAGGATGGAAGGPPTAPIGTPPAAPTVPATVGAGSTITPGSAPGAAPDEDPPRTSYARLSCPDAVVVDTAFDVIVGLAAQPDQRVVGEAMTRPPTSMGAYTITIQLVADGMRLAEPMGTWRVDLPVTADEPYPATTVRLLADPTDQPITATSIRAMYSVDGSPIGLAVRSVAIVRSAELMDRAPASPTPAPGVDLALPSGQIAPDLTVRIERANHSRAAGSSCSCWPRIRPSTPRTRRSSSTSAATRPPTSAGSSTR